LNLALQQQETTGNRTFATLTAAQREATRCLQCADAPCQEACPARIPVPRVHRSILSGNIRHAAELVRAANPMAHTCGACCPQESLCRSACLRDALDFPVNIRGLHRFASDWEWENQPRQPRLPSRRNHRVAIIGSGPSAIACATGLGRLGISSDIYEREPEAGGIPIWAIPNDRLPLDVVRRDVSALNVYPVAVYNNHEVTSFQDLRDRYSAIFLGVGATVDGTVEVTGVDGPGVYRGLEFLRKAKMTPSEIILRGPVRIIGGGNVAVDCALVANIIGANRISVIYRRSRGELPAWEREVDNAFHHGVDFLFQLQPLAIEREGDLIFRLICRRTTLGLPGEDGRREPIPLPSETISLEAGMVIIAAGQYTQAFEGDLLERDSNGKIVVDQGGRTNLAQIYAGGDAATKGGTVVDAVRSGLIVAKSIALDLTHKK
jgi:glutamate synthase (NADPH/NADH) small chain